MTVKSNLWQVSSTMQAGHASCATINWSHEVAFWEPIQKGCDLIEDDIPNPNFQKLYKFSLARTVLYSPIEIEWQSCSDPDCL